MASKNERTLGGRADERTEQLQRSNLLMAIIDAPATKFTSWEQGFIAALTMFEASVDRKLADIVERVA